MIRIKCVLCGYKEWIPATAQEPMCSKCFGPVTVEAAKVKR